MLSWIRNKFSRPKTIAQYRSSLEECKLSIQRLSIDIVETEQKLGGFSKYVLLWVDLPFLLCVVLWFFFVTSNESISFWKRYIIFVIWPLVSISCNYVGRWYLNRKHRRLNSQYAQTLKVQQELMVSFKEQIRWDDVVRMINEFDEQVLATPVASGDDTGKDSLSSEARAHLVACARAEKQRRDAEEKERARKLEEENQRNNAKTQDSSIGIRRSSWDKFVDFVLSDGPNSKYALICAFCHTHNGLVLRKDLGLKYRCGCCKKLNDDDASTESKSDANTDCTPEPGAPVRSSSGTSRKDTSDFAAEREGIATPSLDDDGEQISPGIRKRRK